MGKAWPGLVLPLGFRGNGQPGLLLLPLQATVVGLHMLTLQL
jgi:hypothetical protein